MPLRMIVDSGAVRPKDVALVGARNLDPPEREFIEEAGVHTGKHAVERALGDVDCVYVAIDFDGLDEDEVAAFMPEPGGISARRGRGAPARSRARTRPSSAPASPASSPTRETSSRPTA